MSSRGWQERQNDTNTAPEVPASHTVEQLLKMLSSGSSRHEDRKQTPPPLPPKPRAESRMTIEAAKRSLGLLPSLDEPEGLVKAHYRPNGATEIIKNHELIISPRAKTAAAQDHIRGSYDLDHSGGTHLLKIHPGNNSQDPKQVAPRVNPTTRGYIVYNSKTSLVNKHTTPDQSATSTVTIQDSKSSSRPTSFSIEKIHETYLNNNPNCAPAKNTVEILEVPTDDSSQASSYNNLLTSVDYDKSTKLLSNCNQSNRHAAKSDKLAESLTTPFITPATDDDDDSDNGVKKMPLTSNEATESIFSDSNDGGGPPRTSTPSNTNFHQQYNSGASSSGNSTGTNNNISSQNTYLSHGTKLSDGSQVEDTLNISQETDELTNTSVQNQSGGCELIGINDISDPKEQSPPIIKNSIDQVIDASTINTPYTVQFFNDTHMSSSSNSPPETIDKRAHHVTMVDERFSANMSQATEAVDSDKLKNLVRDLQSKVDSLNNKVASLTTKVEDLECQLAVHQKNSDNSNSTATTNFHGSKNATHNEKTTSPTPGLLKQSLSHSMSTINRLTPMKSSRSNQTNSNYSYGKTYSRNSTSMSQPARHHQYDYDKSSQALSAPRQYLSNDTRSTLRSNYHASSNSLYGGDNLSSSISPSFNHNALASHSRQSTLSPNSFMNNVSRDNNDLYTSASMLSLSSIGHSTLKKSSIAGSISNLSQVGAFNASLISQWPSQSNFMPSKHQNKDVLFDEDERIIRLVLYNTLITIRLPSWLDHNYSFDKIVEPPSVKLKLDRVSGYRGKDCRSNLFYLPTGECIYFVASIVVLYNADTGKQRHYLGHTDNVKCLTVHPNKLIVASGQSAILNRRDKRPIVRVWNTVSLATLRVIGFNEDFDRSICCLAFSRHDQGATLAVVDESSEHTITLLDWQREKNWRIAEANSGHEPVLAIDFHPIDKFAIVAVGRASVNFWDIRGMTLAKKAGLFDKYDRPKYVLCFTFNDVGETITGDSNGNIIIWPRGTNKPRRIIRDAHLGGVFSILAMKDGSYLTGGRDRRIIEWDESFTPTGRQAELPEHCGGVRFITYAKGLQIFIGTLKNCILLGSMDSEFNVVMQGHAEATTALAIHPNQRKYITGGFDNQIYLTDCASRQVEWSKCMAQPITAACYSPNGYILIFGSISGNWGVLDAVTQELLFEACDGGGTITCVKFSSDGLQFAIGSSDCHLYVYTTNEAGNLFKRVGTCVGHSAPIKEIDWSDDNNYIQSQSMNFELLFWKSNNCRQIDDDSIVHDLKWSTQNCTIGFNTIGIWSDSIDSALITYCDRSNNGDLIVSSTDTGFINIYKAPAFYNQCLSHKYYGNVDKFNFIKFLHDDSRLIAVGARNCVTTEWIIERTD